MAGSCLLDPRSARHIQVRRNILRCGNYLRSLPATAIAARQRAYHRRGCYYPPNRYRYPMNSKSIDPHELEDIVTQTLAYYEQRAEEFRDGTRDHDVSQNIAAFLRHIQGDPPFVILDFGCGPGRDLETFTALGHTVIGLEGTTGFAAMARAATGCEVWEQDFCRLNLPGERFDGIFANASLFHIPSQELPRVLRELHASLKPDGVLFSSNPRGEGEEGWSRGRYGAYHTLEAWRDYMSDASFVELEHYYRPTGVPREQQPWLASVWRRG
jgi:SAM-dependent methyltransferase